MNNTKSYKNSTPSNKSACGRVLMMLAALLLWCNHLGYLGTLPMIYYTLLP